MDLSKEQIKMTKGLAIITMVVVHLFAKKGADVYGTPLIWVKEGVPLVYYLGFLGGYCIPFYCYCTGYALFIQHRDMEKQLFYHKSLSRLIRFLLRFWLIVILFTAIGFFFDRYGEIPGSFSKFLGNFFLLENTYNGAWWFASTYVFFSILSPLFLNMVEKVDSRVLFILFGLLFAGYYLCNMMDLFETVPQQYYWKGFLIKKLSDLWYVSFFYVTGMIMAKEHLIWKIEKWVEKKLPDKRNVVILALLLAVSIAACVVELSVSMYYLAVFYFICFQLLQKNSITKRFFMFFGKHSTNIWLVHMFFYLFIFKNLVFIVKYPVFIFAFMMLICILCSYIIDFIYEKILFYVEKQNWNCQN